MNYSCNFNILINIIFHFILFLKAFCQSSFHLDHWYGYHLAKNQATFTVCLITANKDTLVKFNRFVNKNILKDKELQNIFYRGHKFKNMLIIVQIKNVQI